jgi:hypothetical protein
MLRRTFVFNRLPAALCVALILSGFLSACEDHDNDAASHPSAVAKAITATALAPATSDVQQWAAQQTGAQSPARLAPANTSAHALAAPSDALMPPVIHDVE